jgi:hypothetical protein
MHSKTFRKNKIIYNQCCNSWQNCIIIGVFSQRASLATTAANLRKSNVTSKLKKKQFLHGPHLAAPASPASKAICRPALARICTCVVSVATQTKTLLQMMRHMTVFTANVIKKQRQPQHGRLVHLSFT